MSAASPGRTGALAGEVAVELGLPLPAGAGAGLRARAAWQHGDLTEAVRVLAERDGPGGSRQGARLASELRTYQPGHRLQAPARTLTPGAATRAAGDGPRALHLLTNSLPWTQSGYALRSHGILRAQQRDGTGVGAVTRVGYPVTVGLPRAAVTDVVDGVAYRRMLPRRLAPTPEGRLDQTAELLGHHVARLRPSVLHTTTHYVNGLVVEAVARSTGLPWVYEVRGQLERTWVASRPADERAAAAASERYRLWRARELEMAGSADHVVVLSTVLRDDLVARGLPPASVTVVPNAVDGALLTADGGDLGRGPARARPAEEGLWVGTVSSLVAYEGLDVLLHAVARLAWRGPGRALRRRRGRDGKARPRPARGHPRPGRHAVLPGASPRPTRSPGTAPSTCSRAAPGRRGEPHRDPAQADRGDGRGRPVVASDLPALAEMVADPGAGLLDAPGRRPRRWPIHCGGCSTTRHSGPPLAASGASSPPRGRGRRWRRRYRTVYEHRGEIEVKLGRSGDRTSSAGRAAADSRRRASTSPGSRPVGRRPSLGTYVRQLWSRRHFIWADSRARAFSGNQDTLLGRFWLVGAPDPRRGRRSSSSSGSCSALAGCRELHRLPAHRCLHVLLQRPSAHRRLDGDDQREDPDPSVLVPAGVDPARARRPRGDLDVPRRADDDGDDPARSRRTRTSPGGGRSSRSSSCCRCSSTPGSCSTPPASRMPSRTCGC